MDNKENLLSTKYIVIFFYEMEKCYRGYTIYIVTTK